MNAEQTLNGTAQSLEEHAASCYVAVERHCLNSEPLGCGCCRQHGTGELVVFRGCDVGCMLLEEYEIASRRVRELSLSLEAAHQGVTLEAGDMGSTLEEVRT